MLSGAHGKVDSLMRQIMLINGWLHVICISNIFEMTVSNYTRLLKWGNYEK